MEQDMQHGLPRLPNSQSEAWTPQMLSLERLNAFSLKKGCYPGQEIVARTHYLGQSKRELLCLKGHELEIGASVTNVGGAAIGTVVAVAPSGNMALAVCARQHEPGQILVAEQPVDGLPLLPGLARPLLTDVTLAGSQKSETGA
jgi:folate-binding protein YgfZ